MSLFDCQQLTAAVGEPSVIDALRLAALEGPPRPLAELAVVGMTDYGPVALTSAGELLAPTRARAPSGGLDLESLLRREADAAAHDFEDGLIFARLPDSAPILASVRVAGPRARVDVTYSHAPHPLAQRLLSALGIRCVSADDSGRRARYEVDLREHLARTSRAGPQSASAGACNGYFLYSGTAGKAIDGMLSALDDACGDQARRLAAARVEAEARCPHRPADPAGARDATRRSDEARALDELASDALAADDPPRLAVALAGLAQALDRADDDALRSLAEPDAARLAAALARPRPALDEVLSLKTGMKRSRPPILSLPEAIVAAGERLSPTLVSAAALDELLALAARLPDRPGPNPIALELRFGDAARRPVDLLACWSWDSGALVEPIALVDPPAPLDRLEALWRSADGAPLIDRLDHLWLEFDAGRDGRPVPAVFFTARARRARRAAPMLALTEAVAATLRGAGEDAPFRDACRAARPLAGSVPVPHIGLMFPRPRSPLRLITAPGVWGDDSDVERWLGDDAPGQALRAVWRRVGAAFRLARPALDVGPAGPLGSRGLELQIDRGPLRRSAAAWRAPLAALRAEGLIPEDEAAAFAACYAERRVPGGWLAVFPAYLKLSVDESGAVSAKGYVSVLRSPLPLYELGA